MTRKYRKIMHYSIVAVKVLGMIIGAAAFWVVVIEFMWYCYDLGIPM